MFRILFAFLFLTIIYEVHCDVVGSDALVSRQNTFAFPQTPFLQPANRVAAFAWMEQGFTFQNAATSCLFESNFPVSGTVNLNGGTLTLSTNLVFNDPITLQNLGTIVGQNHSIILSSNTTALPSNTQVFQDCTLYLNNDVTLASAISFKGTCAFNGNGHALILGGSSSIQIFTNALLTLQNVIVQGVSTTNVQCLDDTGVLKLCDVIWQQTGSYKFVFGAFQCDNTVLLQGVGPFAYQSLKTSTILSQSCLSLDTNFTFSYDAIRSTAKNLLECIDGTSQIILNSASLCTTTTGLDLKKGTLKVKGNCTLASETQTRNGSLINYGICFGDAVSSANDFSCVISTASRLQLTQGSLNYKNVSSSSWSMTDNTSILSLSDSTTLRIYKTLNLVSGLALFGNNTCMGRYLTARLIGSTGSAGAIHFVSL